MKERIFREGNFLIPNENELTHWPVIAVDQYTSQPEYWQAVKESVKDDPSSLHCVFPEVYLGNTDLHEIEKIHDQMRKYLNSSLFNEYPDSYIYIERTLQDGRIRKGILGCIDLEAYDYADYTDLPIRATEKTVTERLPSRIAIRKGAPMELSHVILLCDDAEKQLIESFDPSELPLLYDLDLYGSGGHIRGWLVSGNDAKAFNERLDRYYETKKDSSLLFAAGDGNHSIASAKEVYEELKKEHPETDYSDRPERYMSVELENIHDPIQVFEPIHRILYETDPGNVLSQLKDELADENGVEIGWYCKNGKGTVKIDISDSGYAAGTVQKFLDRYLTHFSGEIDYIHDRENLIALSDRENTIGFELPPLENSAFFSTIEENGVYVRKTFSIGESDDKRYYLETRRITEDI